MNLVAEFAEAQVAPRRANARLPGATHPHELVYRALDNDDWHTQFDLSLTYLPTISRPQLAFDPYHHPWPTP